MDTNLDETINPRYLSSLSDEPKQILQPISGYTRVPLLSLEEACEPLLNIVPNLPAHIWVAKQNSKNPADELTQDESAAIHLYTMEWDGTADEARASLYVHLNRTLKLVDRTKLRPWFRYLKLFLTALAKLPLPPRQTIWRGVRKNHSDDYPPGAEVTWWAFSSCTTSLGVLESDLYLGNTGTRTLFSIDAINARTVRSHSHFTAEDEILLLPGTFFEVKSRLNPAPDLYLVHLQQKIPPHTLLEPPFEGIYIHIEIDNRGNISGAQLFPPVVHQFDTEDLKSIPDDKVPDLPWYKRKRILFGIGLAALLVIFIILLTALLATRKNGVALPDATILPQYNNNITVYPPVSVCYAFYPFDYNVQDLYCLHNGQLNQNTVSYITGYVGTGYAIVLNQSIPTWISVVNPLNISNSSFTIEAFVILFNNSIDENLVQFSSNTSMSIDMGNLEIVLNGRYTMFSTISVSTNEWHHVAVVYNAINQYTNVYIDGEMYGQLTYLPIIDSDNANVTMIIGYGFVGVIDQLSISLEAKIDARISWDATVAAYYPLDGSNNGWLLDYGPNCLNATAAAVQSITGVVNNALSFVTSGAYYQASGFTVLNVVNHSFSVALWVRPQNQSGIFLTIANSVTCLLVVGIRNIDNRIVAYLPNATNTNMGVNVLGSPTANFQWVNIVFTWSYQNQAQLYQAATFQGRNINATRLNNGYGEPMVITLGMYHGSTDCSGIDGVDTSKQFVGSIDEVYIFSKELQQNEVQQLNSTNYS